MAVYFIDDRRGAIKIGFSEHPQARLQDIQAYHAVGIRLLAIMPGGRLQEQRLHGKFHLFRLNGEWFRKTEDLAEFIVEVAPELTVTEILNDDFELPEIDQKVLRKIKSVESEAHQRIKAYELKKQREAETIFNDAMEKSKVILDGAREKAETILDDARKEAIIIRARKNAASIVADGRASAMNIITDAKRRAAEIIVKAKDDAQKEVQEVTKILEKAQARADLIRMAQIAKGRRAEEYAERKRQEAKKIVKVAEAFIWDCRCYRCGQPSIDVRARADNLLYCDYCWTEQSTFSEIATRAEEMGLGI